MSIGDKPIIGITAAQQAAASGNKSPTQPRPRRPRSTPSPALGRGSNISSSPCCPAWGLRPAQSSQWLRWELRRRFRS